MATRTAYDAVLGTVLTAANLDKHPGGWIGYEESVTPQTAITSIVDATGLSVNVTVNSSRKVRVSGRVGFTSTVATDIAVLAITDSSNVTLQEGYALCAMGATASHFIEVSCVLNPSAGSNTWKLRVQRGSGGTGTLNTTSGATRPSFILVEDIGPSS